MPKAPQNPSSKSSLSKPAAPRADVLLDTETMERILKTLQGAYQAHPMAELTQHNPYRVLVACVLSLRTQDTVMIPASQRLFAVADTPEKMVTLPAETIEKLVYPVGFYKSKTQSILDFSQKLLDDFGGKVPATIDELLTLRGVGRKTANLVVGLGHGLPAICVDTHVHRICNRLGYIQTHTPDESEMRLREKLPLPYWGIINSVMVLHGQQTCKPIGPRCDVCPVEAWCQKNDVKPRAIKAAKSDKKVKRQKN